MVRLFLEAATDSRRAIIGGREPVTVILSITKMNGDVYVEGMPDDFRVETPITSNTNSVKIKQVLNQTANLGCYIAEVIPGGSVNWEAGNYILVVMVSNPEHKGQCLATFNIK